MTLFRKKDKYGTLGNEWVRRKNKVNMQNLKFVKRRPKVLRITNKCLENGYSSENKTLS